MISDRQAKEALPSGGFLRRYVDWGDRWIPAPTAYHLACGLTLLTQAARRELFFPGASDLYPNLYTLLVGPSSTANKGRAIGGARKLLEEAIPDVILDHPGSPEACGGGLRDEQAQIVIYEEFGTFLASSESGQLAPLREKYTDIYDCTPQSRMLVRDQKAGKKAIKVKPRLSILGGCATNFLEAYTFDVDWEGGFLGRFFTICSEYEDGPEKVYTESCATERSGLAKLLHRYSQPEETAGILLVSPGPCMGRTREAEKIWADWSRKTTERAKSAPSVVRAGIARARGHAIKASLLLAWDSGSARFGGEWRITAEEMATAIAITELHIESIATIAEGLAPDRDARDMRVMLRAFSPTEPRTFGQALARTALNRRRGEEARITLAVAGRIRNANQAAGDGQATFLVNGPKSNVIPFHRQEAKAEPKVEAVEPQEVEEPQIESPGPVIKLFD